jgi:hypothetical protein
MNKFFVAAPNTECTDALICRGRIAMGSIGVGVVECPISCVGLFHGPFAL